MQTAWSISDNAKGIMIFEITQGMRGANFVNNNNNISFWDNITNMIKTLEEKINIYLTSITDNDEDIVDTDIDINMKIESFMAAKAILIQKRQTLINTYVYLYNRMIDSIQKFRNVTTSFINVINRNILRFENIIKPIDRHLSTDEYNNIVKTVPAGSHNDLDIICPICTDKIKKSHVLHLLPCKHGYHSRCLRKYLCKLCVSPSCPVCRLKLTGEKNNILDNQNDIVS